MASNLTVSGPDSEGVGLQPSSGVSRYRVSGRYAGGRLTISRCAWHPLPSPFDALVPMTTSILIRAHNYGSLLAEAIESALSQTVRPVEVVVIDDGSTDDTPDVVAAAVGRSGLVRSVRNERPVGPARAMNQAVEVSTGEYLLPLDADDRLSQRFVELTEVALTGGADVAYGGVHEFGARSGRSAPGRVTHEQMRVENCLPVSCAMQRWVFEQVGGFSPEFDDLAYEDWNFWLGAFECGATFTAVPGCWLEYRQHPSGSRNAIGRGTALRSHLRIYRTHPSVRITDLGRWMARSLRRNLPGVAA